MIYIENNGGTICLDHNSIPKETRDQLIINILMTYDYSLFCSAQDMMGRAYQTNDQKVMYRRCSS